MTRTTSLLLLSWAILAALLYLWPFRLALSPVFHTNDAAWTGPAPGVTFAQNGMLRTERPPHALFQRLVAGDGLTVAVWLTSGARDQAGPARIVTYSDGAASRNFTLAQNHADLVFRLRTSADDPNGLANEITVPDVFTPGRAQHIVVTYDGSALDVYVDGAHRARFGGHGGGFDSWDPAYDVAVGNELTGDRPWRGTIAAVAIDDRAHTPEEVRANFRGGSAGAFRGAVAAYDFTDGPAGARGEAPPELARPAAYLHGIFPELLTREWRAPQDFAFNFGIFALMGALLAARGVGRGRVNGRAALAAVLLVAGVATALESLQFYVDGRTSSMRDLAAAVAGGLAGFLVRSTVGATDPEG